MITINTTFPPLSALIYGRFKGLFTNVTLQTNLKAKNATTQFLNCPFESIAKFNHEILVASEDGLFLQNGNLDDTDNINSYFEIITTDFGVPNIKRLRFLYLSYEASEDLKLTVSTEQEVSDTYTIPARLFGQQGYRLPVSRKLYGRYWTLKISNLTGSDFSFDEIKALLTVLSHGHNQN